MPYFKSEPSEILRKIEVPAALEIIAERFDDALDLMHSDAIVYGGAIRDMVAGLPILGDLDIVAADKVFNRTVSFFRMSSKWTEVRPSPFPRVGPLKKKSSGPKLPTISSRASKLLARTITNPYENKSISAVLTFTTFDDARVQIMRASKTHPSLKPKQLALSVIKDVDIRCCGLAMDSKGIIYEVVEGAEQDCKDKILKVNRIDDNLELEHLQSRIKKLKDRGWSSKINIASIRSRLKKKQSELEKAKKEVEKQLRNVIQYSDWLSIEKEHSSKRHIVVISQEAVHRIGHFDKIERLVFDAGKRKSIRLYRSQPAYNQKTWRVKVSSRMTANRLCKELHKEIQAIFNKENHEETNVVWKTLVAYDENDAPDQVEPAPLHHFKATMASPTEVTIDANGHPEGNDIHEALEGYITIDTSEIPPDILPDLEVKLAKLNGATASRSEDGRSIKVEPRKFAKGGIVVPEERPYRSYEDRERMSYENFEKVRQAKLSETPEEFFKRIEASKSLRRAKGKLKKKRRP